MCSADGPNRSRWLFCVHAVQIRDDLGTGILSVNGESRGNGIKTGTWEREWKGVGMDVDGNENDPYFHMGKNPTDFCTIAQSDHN